MADRKKVSASKPRVLKSDNKSVSNEERTRLVSETAYFIAERRGFMNGDALSDWLQAEQQINTQLNCERFFTEK